METGKMPLRTYNEIYREQDQLYRTAARTMGLSEGTFWLLYTLREAGRPLTQSHICAAGCLPKQTVHSALQKLALAGYLSVEEGRDRRSKLVRLSPAGEALAAKTVDRVLAAEGAALDGMDAGDRERFLVLLRRYTALLGRYMPGTAEETKENFHETHTII